MGTHILRRSRFGSLTAAGVLAAGALALAGCGSSSGGGSGSSGGSSSSGGSASTGSTSSSSGGGSSAPAAKAAFTTVNKGELTVAASATPPDFIVSPTGGITGVIPDILTKFAAQHGLKLKYQVYSFSAALTAVEGGHADVGGAIYYTKPRAKAVQYTSPYAHDGSYMVLPSNSGYTGPSWLQGKTGGVAAGYAQVPYVQKALGDNHVLQFPNDQAGVEAVKTGRAVGYITGGEATYYIRGDKTLKAVTFKEGDLGQPASVTTQNDNMFTSCKNPQLAAAIDKEMATMRDNGQMKQIFTKYNQADIMYTTGLVRKSLCGS